MDITKNINIIHLNKLYNKLIYSINKNKNNKNKNNFNYYNIIIISLLLYYNY